MCSDSTKYAIINYYIDKEYTINAINTNDEISIIKEQEIKDLYKIFSSNFFNYQKDDIFKSIKSNAYMCIGNLGTGDKYNPKNLRKCKEAVYNKINDSYECKTCISGYILDEATKTCKQIVKLIMKEHPGLDCYVENIGTYLDPIYSCKSCYNPYDNLMTTESGAKICVYDYDILICPSVNVYTNYINNIYECTSCSTNFNIYNSKF